MKKEVSPKIMLAVIAVALLVLVTFAYRTWTAPSSVHAPGVSNKPVGPMEGGGPTEEDLKKIREYNAAHPESQSRYR